MSLSSIPVPTSKQQRRWFAFKGIALPNGMIRQENETVTRHESALPVLVLTFEAMSRDKWFGIHTNTCAHKAVARKLTVNTVG